jgi:hypothetical protein
VASSYPPELGAAAAPSAEKDGGDHVTPKVSTDNYLTYMLQNANILAQYELSWKKDKMERRRLNRESRSAEKSPFDDDDEVDEDDTQLRPTSHLVMVATSHLILCYG